MFVGVVFLLVALSWIANKTLLPLYYKERRQTAILQAYTKVSDTIKLKPNNLKDEAYLVEGKYSVRVIVTNINLQIMYGERNLNYFTMNSIPDPRGWTDEPFINYRGENTSLRYMSAMGMITTQEATYYVIIDSTVDAINESVDISNSFQLYIGLVMMLVSGILIVFFNNSFLKPILAVNQATKQMAKLDFSQKIAVTSKDEVGELAQNINFLSNELESTISNLQTTNVQLHKELEHREQVDRMRQEFISNVSHELKTPIALIMGYSEGLKVNVNEDDRDFYCEVITDEANKMNKMVRRLLYVAQLDSGAMQPEKAEFFIKSVVERCLNKQSITIKEKGIKVEMDAPKDYLVDADFDQIEQVVTNYLTNALHHINEMNKIRISISDHDGWVKVAVHNTGSAIPAESLPHLWESFYKVDKARTREYGGTGLGLYIVRTIIDSHQGVYGVSNIEDGVEFWFELPIIPE